MPKVISWLYTFVLVLVGWVLFNLTDFSQMLSALAQMFTFNFTKLVPAITADTDIVYSLIYIPLGIICMFPWAKKITIKKNVFSDIVANGVCLILLAVCIVYILGSTYNPFIYRF